MNKDCTFNIERFDVQTGQNVTQDSDKNNFNYPDFLNYITDKKDVISENIVRIHVTPNEDDIEELLCGVAPMWKEYESKESFEQYYTLSEMMRALYCNEIENNALVPIYVSVNDERFIVTWQSKGDNDIFNYRPATDLEIGFLNILYRLFKDRVFNDNGNEYKSFTFINIEVHKEDITMKKCQNVYKHMQQLDYSSQNVIFNTDN